MKSYRPERVANVIRQVVSDAMATKLADPRVAPLSSVTRVEVSGDLEHAKVFMSVMGDEATGRRTVAGLQSARPLLHKMLGRSLRTRAIPRLSFHLDSSLKQAAETNRLIDEALAEDARRHGQASTEPTDAPADSTDGPSGPGPGEDA